MTDNTPPQSPLDADKSLITDDLFCISCGHNLRGLRASDTCPSCRKPISATIELVVDEALCQSCLKLNPAIALRCRHCGAPLTAAGRYVAPEGEILPDPAYHVAYEDTPAGQVGKARRRMMYAWYFLVPPIVLYPLVLYDYVARALAAPNAFGHSPIDIVAGAVGVAVFLGMCALLAYFTIHYKNLKHDFACRPMTDQQRAEEE